MGDPITVDDPDLLDGLYRSGATARELGTPTPVFETLVREKRVAPGRTLVPGCGTGPDAVARAGFTVTGVDFSAEAITRARRLAQASGVPVEFLEADIFSPGDSHARIFDHVFEYVTHGASISPRRGREVPTIWKRRP